MTEAQFIYILAMLCWLAVKENADYKSLPAGWQLVAYLFGLFANYGVYTLLKMLLAHLSF